MKTNTAAAPKHPDQTNGQAHIERTAGMKTNTVAAPKHPDQTNGQAHDINSSRKRRLSKRERKNLKKRKTSDDEIVHVDEASLHDNGHEKPTTCSYTLEQYMANYTPAPITKHLSKQQGDASSSLGKWFPKATVIKSSVCYSNDYMAALTKKNPNSNNIQEPKASLVLFYQYVSPPWTPGKVAALSTYITDIVKSHRQNLGGRMRISTEGVNCTVSAASTHSNEDAELEAARTLRHFAEDLRNFDPVAFEETDFKYVDGLSADRHFKEMKILPVKELVFYGIREDEEEGAAMVTTEETGASAMQVLPKNAKGGIHLEANEYHEMLKKNDAVVIDVRNHYEAAIGRFDGQIMLGQKKKGDQEDQSGNNGHDGEKSGAQYIDPKMRKSTDFTSWLDEPETKQKLEGKTVMMFCTGGIRCERASAYLNSKMGSDVKGVYQLKGGIERYLQAFPDGGFWRGKNFVFDKREAIGAGNVNGDGGVIRKEGSKNTKVDSASDDNQLLSWGAECASCKRPWDRYIGKRKCYTCGVPVLVCDKCMSKSCTHKKSKKSKNSGSQAPAKDVISKNIDLDQVRCPLCVEEGITVPAEEVEYTDNGVRGRTNSFSKGGEVSNISANTTETKTSSNEKKAAKSVLKWGGGHAIKKKEKRRYSRKLCQFGADCVRKDCFFYHPEREKDGMKRFNK